MRFEEDSQTNTSFDYFDRLCYFLRYLSLRSISDWLTCVHISDPIRRLGEGRKQGASEALKPNKRGLLLGLLYSLCGWLCVRHERRMCIFLRTIHVFSFGELLI